MADARLTSDDSVAATRLAAAALELVVARGTSVLDVGTGTGALAARARALGARVLVGIDREPGLVAAACAAVPEATFVCAEADAYLRAVEDGRFAVVVANLPAPPLIELVPELARAARRALVVVGARLAHGRALRAAIERAGWMPTRTLAADGWCGYVAQRPTHR